MLYHTVTLQISSKLYTMLIYTVCVLDTKSLKGAVTKRREKLEFVFLRTVFKQNIQQVQQY